MQQEDSDILEERVVAINRCAKVVKGGRRFSFSALVIVGNRGGRVGLGFGKANEITEAIRKGIERAKKNLVTIKMKENTIPHETIGRFGSAKVVMRPATMGTGIIAGAAVRAVLELGGIKDVLTKSLGSNNVINVVRATFAGLQGMISGRPKDYEKSEQQTEGTEQ